jgi:hypothetical protein
VVGGYFRDVSQLFCDMSVTLYHPPPSMWIRSFLKSKVQPPPPEGSVGLSEKSKVQPPPVGGSVGRSEKSKVQPSRCVNSGPAAWKK